MIHQNFPIYGMCVCVCICECVYMCVYFYNIPVLVHLITHSVCLSTEAVKVSNPYSHINWSSNSLIS